MVFLKRSYLKSLTRRGYLIIGVLGMVVLLIYAFYGSVMPNSAMYEATPSGDFEDYRPPPAPDYAQGNVFWAALPDMVDAADRSPAGLSLDRQDTVPADVFYIHPTTYISSNGWNQPLDDGEANKQIEIWALPAQAAAFNGCCRVFAPKYRQATIAAFFDTKGNGAKALDLAYGDIAAAFANFLEVRNKGRPFILAGHSQGSHHIHRLLNEAVTPAMIADQVIAVYMPGQPIPISAKIVTCKSATDTGCQISWNTQKVKASMSIGEAGDTCVNPITWVTEPTVAAASSNLGSVDFGAQAKVEKDVVDAQCRDGFLIVTDVVSDNFAELPFGPGNYHRYDYSLYHMDIRANAVARVNAFLSKKERG